MPLMGPKTMQPNTCSAESTEHLQSTLSSSILDQSLNSQLSPYRTDDKNDCYNSVLEAEVRY